jgi:hypothetical protein
MRVPPAGDKNNLGASRRRRWNLWHGKVEQALEIVDERAFALGPVNTTSEHRR